MENSKSAIDAGVYDVGAEMDRSGRDLRETIQNNTHPTVITEIKFSSPSLGIIRSPSDPTEVARQMVSCGASALSVLTQPHLFGGSPEYFMAVRESVDVPMLMKDIIIDRVQVDAGRAMGADYVLLIQSIFENGHAGGPDTLIDYIHDMGMGVLLEVHTADELRHALQTDADIMGINNRNLDTLRIDLDTTARLLEGLDADIPIISESGIRTAGDIRYLHECGADAFLVGSSIMKSEDICGRVRELTGAY